MSKIFCIGLNKTGTSTLAECLRVLGFSHLKCSRDFLEDYRLKNDFTKIFKTVEQFDSFSDWPWPLIYKELDKNFPQSRFILTIRKNPEVWIKSLKRHSLVYTNPQTHCRKLAYGYNYPFGKEEEHIKIYEEHNKQVVKYFDGRQDDLLILNFEEGDGWEKICNFLGKDIPTREFPHRNKKPAFKLTKKVILNSLHILFQYAHK
jgi:hypothetical protein